MRVRTHEISSLKPHTLNRCSRPLGPAQRCLRVLYPTLYARGPNKGRAPGRTCPSELRACLSPRDKFVPIRSGSKRSPWVYPRDAGCEFDCSWRIPENFVQLVEICWENELNVFTPRVLSGYFFPNQIGWTVREGTLVLSAAPTMSIALAIRTH